VDGAVIGAGRRSAAFRRKQLLPPLDAARGRGIEPLIVWQPGIAMDIDHPVDLVAFLRMSPPVPTRTLAFIEQSGIACRLLTGSKIRDSTSAQRF
jgi:2-phospho-L-lactate/phosphoenolpyruvate guanylyltransferase